jgi:ribosomal protein S27AE
MDKFRKSLESDTENRAQAAPLSFSEKVNNFEFDDNSYNSKMKVECLCPKCGQRHVMAFHWIGRGTPRKYCPSCKGGSIG